MCYCRSCGTTSRLTTDYASWNVNLKGASDFKHGAATLTPSAQLFGGNSRTNQGFSQTLLQLTGANPREFYTASTKLKWTDWGAKVGLETKLDAASWLQLGLSGNVGVAARDASLSGNDSCVDAIGTNTCTGVGPLAFSSVSSNATVAAFLANAEASVAVMPSPGVRLRGFVGLNYDSRVPGVAAPTFGSPIVGGALGTPAGIKFASETSWYAGGGVLVKFGP